MTVRYRSAGLFEVVDHIPYQAIIDDSPVQRVDRIPYQAIIDDSPVQRVDDSTWSPLVQTTLLQIKKGCWKMGLKSSFSPKFVTKCEKVGKKGSHKKSAAPEAEGQKRQISGFLLITKKSL